MRLMKLFRYRPEYLEAVLTLHRNEMVELSLRLGKEIGIADHEEESDIRSIEEVYLKGGGEFLVGLIHGAVIAMGGFQRLAADSAELRRMRIRKDLQGQGYGSQLLRALEQAAYGAGITRLSFETAKARPLTLEFYRKHGYTETGTGFYGNVETVHFGKKLDEQALQ